MRGHDHLVARTDPACAQGERERRGSGCHAHAVRRLAVLGELSLEPLDLPIERERAGREPARERLVQFAFDAAVLSVDRDKAHDLAAVRRGDCCCLHKSVLAPYFLAVYLSQLGPHR